MSSGGRAVWRGPPLSARGIHIVALGAPGQAGSEGREPDQAPLTRMQVSTAALRGAADGRPPAPSEAWSLGCGPADYWRPRRQVRGAQQTVRWAPSVPVVCTVMA